jgi:metal-responsive CopG/Arc/MetJ family transcriptional regulator
MTEKKVAVRLNQQQLELLDGTVSDQAAASRAELILRALREYHAEHFGRQPAAPVKGTKTTPTA